MTDLSQTIEPACQEAILKALPEDGELAIAVMCQLLANMILSIKGPCVDCVDKSIRAYLAAYEGT